MKINSIIIRYGEISLKGKNRIDFELKLRSHVEKFLKAQDIEFAEVVLIRGRIYVKGIKQVPDLKKIFGIHSFSPAFQMEKNLESLKKEVLNFSSLLKDKKSFRVSCQRIDKNFPHTSVDIERDVGEVLRNETKVPVNLTDPDFDFQVEVGEDGIYIFTEKITGFGGLPFGSAGKLVSLVSSGIDSPVATFLMMKRGVEPTLIHFKISDEDSGKVLKLKEKLEEYSGGKKLKIHVIERDDIFKGKFQILYKNNRYHSYICLLCKYLMHKKAGEIAKKEKALGIITGDNLAQVASQTLKNLYTYRTTSELPVYSPLISFDKEKTINIAKEIGTYEISILKSRGCIPPKNPKTGASFKDFQRVLEETDLK